MKKTFKLLLYACIPLFLLIIIISSIDILKTDFKYAHQSLYTYQNPFNWFSYKVKTNITKSLITFKKNNKSGLPTKHIYLNEKFQNELLAETPSSTKIWKDGFLMNSDNSTDKIKIRLKGDNPGNWLFLKKHWKIKKRKKDLTERQRYFEYIPFDYELFLSGRIANSLKLISPDLKIVELFINDESQGIYTETETLNEGFLRRNRIMPVNLYKGEQILSESIVALENNLLNSPGALKKIAYFNQIQKDDKSDLKFLSAILQLAHNSDKSYSTLMELIDLKYWSKFLSYQILTQNYHNDYSHNFRMISDPWSGKFTLIVHDPLFNLKNENIDLNFDHSSNELFVLLNQNSYFQDFKFEHLNSILNANLIENEIANINLLDDKIKISEGRDVELLSKHVNLTSLLFKAFSNKNDSNIINYEKEKFLENFLLHLKNIRNFLATEPKAQWYENKNGFEVYVNGALPISNLNLFFKNEKPNWVALDLNENGKVDKNELKLELTDNENIKIPYRLYANRIPYSDKIINLSRPELKILPTRFKFISQSNIKPDKINFKNPLSKKEFKLIYEKQSSFPVSKYNTPITNEKNIKNKIIIEGKININKTKVYKDMVEIKAGTTFHINNGASVIFKNQLIALGTKEKPIVFMKKNTKPWGAIVLQGSQTKNSILENIVFEGGSGDTSGNIKYTGALSIHDTKNIIIKNISMKKNSKFDDMLHVVYVDNIKLEKLHIKDSFMDAVDIDMSKNVVIKNVTIEHSGNDGIDLMESDAIISNVKIYNSKDKGISVGENSFLILNNSLLSKNDIGIATKDRSYSFLINSTLTKNNISLNNYKKNWQYAGGGIATVYKSKLTNKENTLVDKYSTIQIINSDINNINIKQKTIFKKKNKTHLLLLKKNDFKKVIAKLKANNINIVQDADYIGIKN